MFVGYIKVMKVEITSPSDKVQKAVMAHFVRVLEDEPKGLTVTEIKHVAGNEFGGEFTNQTFKLPQGPALINGQWV